MAHDGSCWASAVNAFTVSGKKNECSIATARLNYICAAALHEIGKLTSPNFSSWARAAGWARKIATDQTTTARETPVRDMTLSSVRLGQTVGVGRWATSCWAYAIFFCGARHVGSGSFATEPSDSSASRCQLCPQ